MQPVRDTSTMRVIPRGLEIADDELSIDFGLDLDIGDDEDLSEEAAKQMDDLQISMEPELPEPSGSSLSGEPIPALKDMSVSIEPEIPIIEPIEPEIEIPMEDITIPQIEEISSVHSSDTISQRRMSVGIPIDREEVVSEKDIDIDMEDITQRRDRRKKVKRKKKKKVRFNKDDVIELEDADRLIDLNNTQDVREYTIERPHFSHIDDRPLREGEFEELFTRSLSGIYANNALTDAFKEFTMMILDPSIEEERIERDRERMDIEQPLGDIIQPIEPIMDDIIEPMDDTIEPIEEPRGREVSIIASIASTPSLPGDMFAGYKIDEMLTTSTPEQMPIRQRRRLDELGDISVSDEIDIESVSDDRDIDMDRDRRKELKLKKRMERRDKTSSEELSVPQELSKLTAFFKEIVDDEIRKLEREGMDEEDVKINLEEMLEYHAQQNNSNVNKRDIALGFMQTLILKNENIIDVEQEEWNGDIFIFKGPRFDTQIPQ